MFSRTKICHYIIGNT